MASKTADEIIEIQEREWSKQSNFRSLWQQTSDLVFPRENQIETIQTAGKDKSVKVYDPTAIFDSQDMASGFLAASIPSGQQFFGLVAKKKELNEIDRVSSYLADATRITHEELFESNFILQLNETLRSLIVFGTGNLYSEWDNKKLGLNFKDWDITFYQFLENNHGLVDTVILKHPMTARQAIQEFGNKAGELVLLAAKETKTANKTFDFIHYVAPREKRNLEFTDTLNMSVESVFVNVKERIIVFEDGFDELPFAVCRWMKSSHEKWGRGQGTESLSAVKTLQQMYKDFVECGNKWNSPPREILDTFEGMVDVRPNANNYVSVIPSIKAIDDGVKGNFPITKDVLEFQQEIVHRAFYADVFAPLKHLTGDRRNELEIRQRIKEAMKKLNSPVYRVQSELFTPVITRCVLLLLRNGRIPKPPPELQGQRFGIEFIGELALALRNYQAKAFMEWTGIVGEIEAAFPDVNAKDNIDFDSAIRRMGRALGVNEEDMASEEERDATRDARAQQMAAMQAMEAAGAAAEGYQKTSKAAEAGSPAGELMGAIAGE